MEDNLPHSATLILEQSEHIDVDLVSIRMNNMAKAFIDFVSGQVEGVEGVVNLEMPIILAMGLMHINSISMRLGVRGSSPDFVAAVKQSILDAVEEDFDTCFKMGESLRE